MAVTFFIVGVVAIAVGFVGEVYEVILIRDLSNRPSIVHNNTFVYNDTHVKNITHTHIFNEYRIENSTVNITMLDGSSCVIADIIHGIQRTACTQNTDNPLAIAQFSELAIGLNDTVTGVHVTIGSVSKSVLEMHEKSDKIMNVLNSLVVMGTNTIPGVQATIGLVSTRVQAIETRSEDMMQVLTSLKDFPKILQFEVEKNALQKTVIDQLTEESTRQKAVIDQLTKKSTSQQAEIDSIQSAECFPGNNYQTPVPPGPAGTWWYHPFVMFILLLFNSQQIYDNLYTKNELREIFKRFIVKNKYIQDLKTISEHRKKFKEELKRFHDDLPELNKEIQTTLKMLSIFQKLLAGNNVDNWTTLDTINDKGLTNQDRVEQIVKYLQEVCRSYILMGKFGRESLKVRKHLSAMCIQKWAKRILARIAARRLQSTETLKTPPQTQPEQSTAPVVVVPLVCKQRAPTRAGAPVSKPTVHMDDALEECRTDWKEIVFLLFVCGVFFWLLFWFPEVSPAQCTADNCQNTTHCWLV
jgi:hypothetical protein